MWERETRGRRSHQERANVPYRLQTYRYSSHAVPVGLSAEGLSWRHESARDERGRTRSAGDERGAGRAWCGTSVGMSAVGRARSRWRCSSDDLHQHAAHISSKRSAWRACGSTSDCVHTFGLEEPPSAEIGRRRTSKARGCHAATPAMLSPETENCWCKLPSATQLELRCK